VVTRGRGGSGRKGRTLPPFLPLLPLLLSGCELTEVTVPVAESRIVVHSVLRRLASQQFVLLERSITGQGATGDNDVPIPPSAPARPIAGALVTLDYRSGPCAGTTTLPELPQIPGLYQLASVCAPLPGDVVGLQVVTAEGEVVTGTTTIPGASQVVAQTADTSAAVDGFIALNQDRDTLRMSIAPIVARAMRVEVREGGGGEPKFYALTDAMALTIPADLINPFEGDDGEMIFRAGFEYILAIVVADTNYYDFARSFNDPLTARGFINRLTGGIGVFGSVETHRYTVRVVSTVDDPREGEYRLTGTLAGRPVDITLELYLQQRPAYQFGAFVVGDWFEGPVRTSGEGVFGITDGVPQDLRGVFVSGPDSARMEWTLAGRPGAQGSPFPVSVQGSGALQITGSLTATQTVGTGAIDTGGPRLNRPTARPRPSPPARRSLLR
jgi:hypothetical protein